MAGISKYTFKTGILLGVAVALMIHFALFSSLFYTHSDRSRSVVKKITSSSIRDIMIPVIKDNDCNCPIDFQTEKQNMAEIYMNSNTSYDDPGLIDVIRKYFLEPPKPNAVLRLSVGVRETAQAEMVLKVLNKTSGFFVESGAFDGEMSSNTIYLEQRRSWTGLLIEMDPGLFLQTKGKQRRSVISSACLSPKKHPVKVRVVQNPRHFQASNISLDLGGNHGSQYAYCFPFYSFMLAMGKTEIDYWSLDVEGVELEVLRTVPFDKLDIKVLTVEYKHSLYNKSDFVDFMKEKGYTVYADLVKCASYCRDFVFVRDDLFPLDFHSKKHQSVQI